MIGAQPVDNMIDPAYRQGLGRARLQRALYSTIQRDPLVPDVITFGYGFPNREAYRIGRKLLGYSDLGPVHVRLRSLTGARHVRRLLGDGRISRTCGRAHARCHRGFLRFRAGPPPDAGVRCLQAFDDRFDGLWEQASAYFRVAAVRDRKFLEWRYGRRPSGDYTLLALERDKHLLGYTILALRDGPVRIGRVADILCLPGRGRAESLLVGALDFFLREGCDMAECWSPSGGIYHDLIRRYFPRRLPDPVPAVTKIYDDSLDQSLSSDLSRWHLTMGDADGV